MSKFAFMIHNETISTNSSVGRPVSSPLVEGLDLFFKHTGQSAHATPLVGAGSGRLYWRLQSADDTSAVYTWGKDLKENRVFCALSQVFHRKGIRVPRILEVTSDGHGYLQEDLGRSDLLSYLSTDSRFELSAKALRELVKMQFVPREEWESLVGSSPFNRRQVMWDLNYFKYEFLKVADIPFDEEALENDFERLATSLTSEVDCSLWGFMFRDFQSRNVIVSDNEVGFIDYQSGRLGPCLYDAISFLWQAKAKFTDDERSRLLDVYAREVNRVTGNSVEKVLNGQNNMVLFRLLQVMGAYGFRGLIEKKAHFIESIPPALSNLKALLTTDVFEGLDELKRVVVRAVESRFADSTVADGLTVTVFSFSYKKGYPEDLSGNGGGFMFDCRGIHNPGRYEHFRPLTGLDPEVKTFLEERGEVNRFIESADEMVSPTIERYISRGFNSLQIGFGCTGGRHRSVYCAEQLAHRIAEKHPTIRVVIIHREQGIKKHLTTT